MKTRERILEALLRLGVDTVASAERKDRWSPGDLATDLAAALAETSDIGLTPEERAEFYALECELLAWTSMAKKNARYIALTVKAMALDEDI